MDIERVIVKKTLKYNGKVYLPGETFSGDDIPNFIREEISAEAPTIEVIQKGNGASATPKVTPEHRKINELEAENEDLKQQIAVLKQDYEMAAVALEDVQKKLAEFEEAGKAAKEDPNKPPKRGAGKRK